MPFLVLSWWNDISPLSALWKFFFGHSMEQSIWFVSWRHSRWGSEQRPIKKLKALRCLKAFVLWPHNDKAHSKPHLLYQFVYQSPCSAFRHSWIRLQDTWPVDPEQAFGECSHTRWRQKGLHLLKYPRFSVTIIGYHTKVVTFVG